MSEADRINSAVITLSTQERRFIASWLEAEKAAVTGHLETSEGWGDPNYLPPIVDKLQMIVGLISKLDQGFLRSLLGGDE